MFMKKWILFYCLLLINYCNSSLAQGLKSIPICNTPAAFFSTTSLAGKSCAFSTTEKKMKGVVLIDANSPEDKRQFYQHASWKQYGNMGALAIDNKGNAYTAPVPFIAVKEASRQNQNTLYKVDAKSGIMQPYIAFKKNEKANEQNAFGIVGLFFDCESKILYISTIAGSTAKKEVGTIYAVDTNPLKPKVIDSITNIDAMGVGVAFLNNEKKIFFGAIRQQSIRAVSLKANGTFSKNSTDIINLINIGIRGDDVCKKIRFSADNKMLVTGTPFNYNLVAPTSKQESVYTFALEAGNWLLKKTEDKNVLVGY
jgi:hypothetical protein